LKDNKSLKKIVYQVSAKSATQFINRCEALLDPTTPNSQLESDESRRLSGSDIRYPESVDIVDSRLLYKLALLENGDEDENPPKQFNPDAKSTDDVMCC
jgi:hypothetical protein